MSEKFEAKVKDDYILGSVMAFSGREYTQSEWRPVPIGFEDEAISHPLLDVRDADTKKEIRVKSHDILGKEALTSSSTKTLAGVAEMKEPETKATEETPLDAQVNETLLDEEEIKTKKTSKKKK